MSRKDQEEWAARLAADPGLSAAWDDYRDMLARMTAKNPLCFTRQDLEAMRDSMERLLAEDGKGQMRH